MKRYRGKKWRERERERERERKDSRKGGLCGFFRPSLSVVTTYTVSKQPPPEINLPSLAAVARGAPSAFPDAEKAVG